MKNLKEENHFFFRICVVSTLLYIASIAVEYNIKSSKKLNAKTQNTQPKTQTKQPKNSIFEYKER